MRRRLIAAQVPMPLLAVMRRYINSRGMFLLALNVLLLLVGCLAADYVPS